MMLTQGWERLGWPMGLGMSGALPGFIILLFYVYLIPYPVLNLEHYQGYNEVIEITGFLKSLLKVMRS